MSNVPAFPAQIAKNCWHCQHRTSYGRKDHYCKEIADATRDAGLPVSLHVLGWNQAQRYVSVNPDAETSCPYFEQIDYAEACAKYGKDYADGLGGKLTWG